MLIQRKLAQIYNCLYFYQGDFIYYKYIHVTNVFFYFLYYLKPVHWRVLNQLYSLHLGCVPALSCFWH